MNAKPPPQKETGLLQSSMGFDPARNPLHIALDNPYDLRPVLNVAMAEIEREYEDLQESQKLVVLYGETHNIASHHALKSMLCARMKGQILNPLVALEFPHDSLPIEYRHSHPSLVLNAGLLCEHAPYSYAQFNNTLSSSNIATALVDCSRKEESVGPVTLNERDPKTHDAINYFDVSKTDIEKILAISSAGMVIRNIAMLKEAFSKAAKPKEPPRHDLIFMPQGANHIMGSKSGEYKNSSHGLLHNAGFTRWALGQGIAPKVITIMPDLYPDFNLLLEPSGHPNHRAALKRAQETIIALGVDDQAYSLKKEEINAEKETLTKIYRASGFIGADEELPEYMKMKNDAYAEITKERLFGPIRRGINRFLGAPS